jgi:hypothetical protein
MGFIYLINMGNTDLYKIGVTKKPIEKRKKALQTANPLKLSITHFYETDIYHKVEKVLHRNWNYKKYIEEDFENLSGEWFKLNSEDLRNFADRCKKIEEGIKYIKENSTLDLM